MDRFDPAEEIYTYKSPSRRKISPFKTQIVRNTAGHKRRVHDYVNDIEEKVLRRNNPQEGSFAQTSGSEIERFISAIQSLWAAKSFAHRSEVAKSLNRLRHACIEDEIDLSTESIQFFIDFIREHEYVSRPNLAITDSGHIRATWSGVDKRHFAVEFLSAAIVKFVFFSPDAAGDFTRIAGAIPRRQIKSLVRQLKVTWI